MPSLDRSRKLVRLSDDAEAVRQLWHHQRLVSRLTPWNGHVPEGYLVDFLGALTDMSFRSMWGIGSARVGGQDVKTILPTLEAAEEGWFEAANWAAAAGDAAGEFVMISLGAQFGAQAVGSYLALRQLNPMPCKLVAVEPEPGNFAWMKKHFRDNGIDPDAHWLLQVAVSDSSDPVFFPVGATGSGANDCIWTNSPSERDLMWRELMERGDAAESLRRLLASNSTGLRKSVQPGAAEMIEIKYVSAITVDDILGPFDFVDYLETDLQRAEFAVLPPAIETLRRKVRRLHVGTHGVEGHQELRELFERGGWTVVFSYEPYTTYETPMGRFSTDDGVLTLLNEGLQRNYQDNPEDVRQAQRSLQHANRTLQEANRALQAELDATRGSTSWRLTAPLRALRRYL